MLHPKEFEFRMGAFAVIYIELLERWQAMYYGDEYDIGSRLFEHQSEAMDEVLNWMRKSQ